MARRSAISRRSTRRSHQEMERDPTRHRHGRGHRRRHRRARRGRTPGAACSASPRACTPKFGPTACSTRRSPRSAFIGAAAGAAASGLRPVAELMFVDFMGVCFDQIFNQAAKFRYMFGGKAVTPVVIRTMYGAGIRAAVAAPPGLYPIFTHIPGLKVVLPVEPLRRQGPADPGDPRRRPGHLLRAQGAVRRSRARCRRRPTRSRSARPTSCARATT